MVRASPTVTRELAGALHVPDVGEELLSVSHGAQAVLKPPIKFGSSSARVMLMTMGRLWAMPWGWQSEEAARRARAVTRAAQRGTTGPDGIVTVLPAAERTVIHFLVVVQSNCQ